MKGLIKPLRPSRQFRNRADWSLKLNHDPKNDLVSKFAWHFQIREKLTLQWDQLLHSMDRRF